MALTSSDETDLLLPLYEGVHEEPRFQRFLDRLRRRTGADYVALAIRKDGSPVTDATVFHSGINLQERARALGIEDLYMLEGVHQSDLRPNRVYSVSEFVDHDPEYRDKRARSIERLGIADERVVRVSEESGISAWLVIARAKSCSAADSALLSNLAPYVTTALRSLNLIERQKIEAALSGTGLDRSDVGWLLFDRDARVIAIENGTSNRLALTMGYAPRLGEKLLGLELDAERELAESARRLAGNPDGMPGAVVLCEDPRIDALLVAADGELREPARIPVPAMIAYCRFERIPSADRAQRFARLFDLPPREAELAIALSDGQSIAEAADAMGLTLETARNYSKRLYTKLGVKGQADLVRLVHRSSAVLA